MRKVIACLPIVVTACASTRSFSTSSPGGSSSDDLGHVTIPNVFKLKKADAVAALRRAGVQGDIEDDSSLCGSTFDGKIVELGEVCYQQPAAGQVQGARLVVSLRVQTEDPRHGDIGKNTEWRLMPSVTGKPYEQALAEMHHAGFENDDRIRRFMVDDASCKPGIVCRQYPDAMERAGLNDDKILYVGDNAPETKPVAAISPPTAAPTSEHQPTPTPAVATPTVPPPATTGEPKRWGGNGAPPYRDADNRVHGPGGPVFMGRGVPCTNKLDHCMRPGVWFAADNVIAGSLFRGVPVFQFENAWWTWRGDAAQQKRLFRTAVVDKPDQLQVGKPVVFFVDEGGERFLDNESDMLTSSRWSVGVVDAVSADSVHIQGWDKVALDTIRMIVEEKQQP